MSNHSPNPKPHPAQADDVRAKDQTVKGGEGDTGARTVAYKPAAQLGEYEIVREIGRGGMGVVFGARHLKRGDRVALKTLDAVDGAALLRFKREFRSAAEINHPNLVGLHTLEESDGRWWFTMDLLHGEDFKKYTRPGDVLDESRLRSVLPQLFDGVAALHERGIVHRDLKPNNVIVTHDGRLIILDFGLALQIKSATAAETTHGIFGTGNYMAPEQAAGGDVSETADWYAVGVILYETLSGQAPFTGDLVQVLWNKRTSDAPPLPRDAGLPEDLIALCERLLERDPGDRPSAAEIREVLSVETGQPAPISVTQETLLIGREDQLAALDDELTTFVETRQPSTVFVSGKSGEGKSSLCEKFLAPVRKRADVVVVSGRCYDRESVPFKALDSLIDALTSYIKSLPEVEAATLRPDDIGMLTHVFPVLQRVPVIAQAPAAKIADMGEQQVRARAFSALRELLRRISERVAVVLFADDLQWGDADSAEALFEVLRPPNAPTVLFIGTYRSDEAADSAFLQAWDELQRKHNTTIPRNDVTVGPLSDEQCGQLVATLLNADDVTTRQLAAGFIEETGGNPFLLSELATNNDPNSDTFRPMPIQEVINRKLNRLPAEATALLEVIAVSGQALSVQEAAAAAGQDVAPTGTLTQMRNERLVRLVGSDDHPSIDTYHDRIRETVLGHLNAERSRGLHRVLAEVIEADVGGITEERIRAIEQGEPEDENPQPLQRVYDLAYHYDEAGEKRKALSYALLAAEQARRQYALEVAVSYFATAKRNAAVDSNAVHYRIAVGYAEALMLLGRYREATAALHGAIELTDDDIEKAAIEALEGENAFKQGQIRESIAKYESGLRRLGNRLPRSIVGLGFAIIRESIVQIGHRLWRGRLHKQPTTPKHQLTSRLFARLVYPTAFTSSPRLMWVALTGLNRAERVAPSTVLPMNLDMLAAALSAISWRTQAYHYQKRARQFREEFDDLWGLGHNRGWNGISQWTFGEYERAQETLEEAVRLFDEAGDLWESNLARFHLACCHYSAGNLAEAILEARKTFEISVRIGDPRANCALYLWSKVTNGALPFDELQKQFDRNPEDILSTCNLDKGLGYWHLFHGRTADAISAFEDACAIPRKNYMIIYHSLAGAPALTTAMREHALAIAEADPRQARRVEKRALKLAKRTAFLFRILPSERARALRELSLVYRQIGKTKKAHKHATKSCTIAKNQAARYEYALSLQVCGELGQQLGRPEADDQVAEATESLAKFQAEIDRANANPLMSLSSQAGEFPAPTPASAASQ